MTGMNCNGMCFTGSDLGEPGDLVAYPHPECPAHNRILSAFIESGGSADLWVGELGRWQIGLPSPWAESRGLAPVTDSFMEATILTIRLHAHREQAA